MTLIDVFVPGDPKGQPRPRAFARNGKARVYDPGTAEGWKSEVALAMRPWAGRRTVGPITLLLAFHFARPKGHYAKSGTLKTSAPAEYVKKPDLDNLAKAVMDALTSIEFWCDDSQVVKLTVEKHWCPVAAPQSARSGMRVLVQYDMEAQL